MSPLQRLRQALSSSPLKHSGVCQSVNHHSTVINSGPPTELNIVIISGPPTENVFEFRTTNRRNVFLIRDHTPKECIVVNLRPPTEGMFNFFRF